MLFEFSIDLEKELDRLLGGYQIIIPQAVAEELGVLSQKGRGKQKRNAITALIMIQKYEVVDVGNGSTADDVIVSAADDFSATVVTNDIGLRQRLKKNNHSVVFLRGKNHLALD